MGTTIEILTMKDIMELYGFSRKEATRLIRTIGCTLLPRHSGSPYKIIKDEFETWLRTRRA